MAVQLLLAACAGPPSHLWLESPGWSRASFLGNTLSGDPVPLAVADDGGVFSLFFVEAADGMQQPELVAVDPTGEIAWRRQLPFQVTRAISPRLILDGEQLHGLWVDEGRLYHLAARAADGEPLGQPRDLSGGRLVGHYDAALSSRGHLTVWFAGPRRQPGLYRLPTLDQQPVLVDPAGIRPDLSRGSQAELHAIWAHYPSGFGDLEFLYAPVPDDQIGPLASVETTLIAAPAIGPTSVLQGPDGAIGQEYGYIFWSVIERTGMSAGSSRTRYVLFDPGNPEFTEEERTLLVPSSYQLTYQPAPQAGFDAGDRVVLPAEGSGTSGYVADLAAVASPTGEVAAAVSSRSTYLRNKNEIQVSVAYLRQGDAREFQLLSFTQAGSVTPTVEDGPQGHLYLSWMEKGELPGFLVYLTSTTPSVIQGMAQLDSEDIGRLAADSAFGMLTGMLIAPIATLVALVIPLLVVGVTAFLRGEDEGLFDAGTLISLGLALVVYWVAKVGVLPAIGDYVPFSAWIPVIPLWLESPLRLGVPVLIGLLGFLVAWGLTYRREVRSPIYFLLIYAAVDGMLTGAVYGLHFYAAF